MKDYTMLEGIAQNNSGASSSFAVPWAGNPYDVHDPCSFSAPPLISPMMQAGISIHKVRSCIVFARCRLLQNSQVRADMKKKFEVRSLKLEIEQRQIRVPVHGCKGLFKLHPSNF
jgi:hypothetical protein